MAAARRRTRGAATDGPDERDTTAAALGAGADSDNVARDQGSTRLRSLWIGMVLIRVACVLSPGYVHPDEHFQNAEVSAGRVLGLRTSPPWEFTVDAPARTLVLPMVVSGVPFALLRGLGELFGIVATLPMLLFVLPRLVTLAASLVVDWCLFRVAEQSDLRPWPIVLAHAMMWPTLVFHVRPFSNTAETILVVVLVAAVVERGSGRSKVVCAWRRLQPVVVGVVAAAGVWCRFTFAFYALPACLAYLVVRPHTGSVDAQLVVQRVVVVLGCAVAAGALLAVLDTILYGKGFTLTPLNSLLYNMDTSNLALHGVHPRFLHFLVNAPLMFGPLWLASIYEAFSVWRQRRSTANLDVKSWRACLQLGFRATPRTTRAMCAACALSGCAVLSAAPHQEARFLLPMGPLLAVAAAPSLNKFIKQRALLLSTFTVGLVFTVFFGVAHQGGVPRALMHIGGALRDPGQLGSMPGCPPRPVRLVFHDTYRPPLFLLGHPSETSAATAPEHALWLPSRVVVEDVDTERLVLALLNDTWHGDGGDGPAELPGQCEAFNPVTLLVTPASAELPQSIIGAPGSACGERSIAASLIASFAPHFSSETPPRSTRAGGTGVVEEAKLLVYSMQPAPLCA